VQDVALEKIERESVAEKVADAVRGRILAGDLAPGTRLVESVLASQLGVSRAPLREAFAEHQKQKAAGEKPGRTVAGRTVTETIWAM